MTVEDEQGWVPSTCLEREDGVKEETAQRFAPGEGIIIDKLVVRTNEKQTMTRDDTTRTRILANQWGFKS